MNRKHLEDLPSDDELESMEDQDGTDIVDPEKFEKMREEIDKVARKIAIGLKDNKEAPSTSKEAYGNKGE